MKNWIWKVLSNSSLYAIFFFLVSASSCSREGVKVEAGSKTLATLDKAINTLQGESTNWRKVLQETQENLVDEANSSIRNEITNLMENGIATVGIEGRCDADFIRNRTRQELVRTRNKLAQNLGVALLPENSLEPVVCHAVPSPINLGLPPESRLVAKWTGYDLDKSKVRVLLLNGNEEIDVTSKLDQSSNYLFTLNLSPANGVGFSRQSNKILVKTVQEGKLISEVNVIQPATFKARYKPGFYYQMEKGFIYLWPTPWDSGLTDTWCDLPNEDMYRRHAATIGQATEAELDRVKKQSTYWSQPCSDDVFQHSRQQNL
jgi:hypothetical protein